MNGSQKNNKQQNNMPKDFRNWIIGTQQVFQELKYEIKFVEYSLNGFLKYLRSFVRIEKAKINDLNIQLMS